jgi:hypothetical protein
LVPAAPPFAVIVASVNVPLVAVEALPELPLPPELPATPAPTVPVIVLPLLTPATDIEVRL